jgi:hypothetical protein
MDEDETRAGIHERYEGQIESGKRLVGQAKNEAAERINQVAAAYKKLGAEQKKLAKETHSFSGDFRDAWDSMGQGVTAGGLAAQGVFEGMRSAWTGAVNAMIFGGKSAGEAIREAVMQAALGVAIESGFRALFETASAIADYARYNYQAGAQHTAAAVSFAATAAVAGGVAGGAYALGGAQVGAGRIDHKPTNYVGGNRSSSYGGGSGSYSGGQQKVVIVLAGGSEKLFAVVDEQNTRNARAGRSAFEKKAK